MHDRTFDLHTASRSAVLDPSCLLDEVLVGLSSGLGTYRELGRLRDGLSELRRELPWAEWREFASECQKHPLMDLLHRDPFTSRAFWKPRGYAGDAKLIDLVYGMGQTADILERTDSLGRAIFDFFATQSPGVDAVRSRMGMMAHAIDQVSHRSPDARVLSVACGHLREASESLAVRDGRLGRFVALDRDDASLAVVRQEYAGLGIRPVRRSVRQLCADDASRMGHFDLIYAAGLYDYLEQAAASTLTHRLFQMLRPGGRLLIANFMKDVVDAGYMEAFMDWWLVYRDASDLVGLAASLPARSVASCRSFSESNRNIVFLDVRKR